VINPKKENAYVGGGIAILSMVFLALAGTFSKLIIHTVPACTLVFGEYFTALLFILPLVFYRGMAKTLKTKRWGLHLVRDVGGGLSYLAFLYSLQSVPLVNATLLLNTAPLWVPFVLYFWLKERITSKLWGGIILGFVGIILILKPQGHDFVHAGTLFALIAGIIYGFTIVCLRLLSKTESPIAMYFYLMLVNSIIMFPFAVTSFHLISMYEFIVILAAGASVFLAQGLIIIAFQYAKASTIAPMVYMGVVFAGLFGYIFFHQVPDFIAFIGIALVIGGGVATLVMEKRK
jgi:drug/metabolite transporter (DMT)-like permease